MGDEKMELAGYLDRIGYSGPIAPTLRSLRGLHVHHLFSIPFENLDIPLKREIVLDLPLLYDKIVRQKRGGFCYEQNGLFAWALREVGFDVTMLSGRVTREQGEYGPEFDHMLLLVAIAGQRWLADVGFGDSFREPLRLEEEERPWDDGAEYHVLREGTEYILARREGDSLERKFRFSLRPRELADFEAMCAYQQTSPLSSFTRRRVCSIATDEGRVTLTENALIVTAHGERTEIAIGSDAEFERLLQERFGIALSGFPPLTSVLRAK